MLSPWIDPAVAVVLLLVGFCAAAPRWNLCKVSVTMSTHSKLGDGSGGEVFQLSQSTVHNPTLASRYIL